MYLLKKEKLLKNTTVPKYANKVEFSKSKNFETQTYDVVAWGVYKKKYNFCLHSTRYPNLRYIALFVEIILYEYVHIASYSYIYSF